MFASGSLPPAVVRAEQLVLGYGSRLALDAASFAVPRGVTVALIGPNGSGKSSLLRAVAGLLRPRSGRLDVPAQRTRGELSLVLQGTDVDPGLPMTVREVVGLARYARLGPWRPARAVDRRAVDAALERLGVAELAHRQLHELSGGQRQRVLVAQGLAQQASLLLLDEPVTSLDAASRQEILRAVDEERAAGRTVLVSTHDFDDARRCDLVLLLANRVVAFGPPAEVLVDGRLAEAYGGQLVRLPSGALLVDDPHHAGGHPCAPAAEAGAATLDAEPGAAPSTRRWPR